MKISRIEIKNWLGLKELTFSPGKINKISGDSGSGKTSVVEALEKVFTNKNRRTEVISHGEKEAELLVALEDGLEISRKTRTEKADYLKVKHDSKAVNSTEGFIKKLINGDIFRPVEFVKKSSTEQAKVILNMLDIKWSADDIKSWFGEVPEADYTKHILMILKQIEAGYYSERESINREVNLLKANVEGIKKDLPPNYNGEEWKYKNLSELYSKITKAEDNNRKLEDAMKLVDSLKNRIEDIQQRAANAEESKKLDYTRQRDTLNRSIEQLNRNIEAEQLKINDVDIRINEESLRLDNELQAAIERLKVQYQVKKQTVKESIMQEAEQSKMFISEYKQQLAAKTHQLSTVDELEQKDLSRIAEYKDQQIRLEQEKTGNAEKIVSEINNVDVEPLRVEAAEAERMKSFLREWDRMNDIIRGKITPKEERSGELTTKIQMARKLPKELLKTVSLPINDLEVDEKGLIRVGGTLIDGLSEGEEWDFAFRLAKAQAGELKVICLDGWQNLGSKRQQILEDAMTDEYQYFLLETVDNKPLKVEVLEGSVI